MTEERAGTTEVVTELTEGINCNGIGAEMIGKGIIVWQSSNLYGVIPGLTRNPGL